MITQTPFKLSAWDEPALKMNEVNIMPHSCQELEGTYGKTKECREGELGGMTVAVECAPQT